MKNLNSFNVLELSAQDALVITGGDGGTDWGKLWKNIKTIFNDLDYAAEQFMEGWNNPR